MRIIAIFANIALLVFMCVEFSSFGFPTNAREVLLVSLATVAPIFSLIALFFAMKSESWLALFLKRKALEERKKIDELGKHGDG